MWDIRTNVIASLEKDAKVKETQRGDLLTCTRGDPKAHLNHGGWTRSTSQARMQLKAITERGSMLYSTWFILLFWFGCSCYV